MQMNEHFRPCNRSVAEAATAPHALLGHLPGLHPAVSGGMRKLGFALTLLVVLGACSGPQSGVTSVPGHGAVAIEIIPNPIVARKVSGNTYDFPFEVVVRETGGQAINITRVEANVVLGGGLSLARESWDAERIRSLGYSTAIPANGERRYKLNPRKEVPDERLFGGVSAELTVSALDASGTETSATTVVTVGR